ncbi:MAG: glutamate 5-kinase [Burkholderiaceae bacterium]|jgi:glutamate 5-kinase|nr:glutamate 5-kinase [Burkholderiaceae bacterium]
MKSVIQQANRLVIKIGSSLITRNGKGLDEEAIAHWTDQIANLRMLPIEGKGAGEKQRREVVIVSSGAIAEGMRRLDFKKRPSALPQLQACAAVGQMGLIQAYETAFRQHHLKTAQVLLTHADMSDRERYLNARDTLLALLRMEVIPIINENDTVATSEIRFGDNDTLGALVANLIEASALIILTDQQGLFSADPRKDAAATLITSAAAGDPALEQMAGGAGSEWGRGGMLTKVLAAKRAARSGAHTVIAWGQEASVLTRLAQGEMIGTQLTAPAGHLQARKQWMMDHLQTAGQLVLDAGAVEKIRHAGKSLLPIGVTDVRGDFIRGEMVTCTDESGKEIARGLINYSSSDARRILRRRSPDIARILGYDGAPELIHRDNLVLL